MKRFGDLRDWFFEKRFGLFVHWGIYSVGERHEQELWRFGTPREEYERYAECFNPVNFNPRAWLDAAENAGMQYLVFTAKHHDGFCMWDTHETDFNIMNTPYRRDVLGMLADECHKRNFPLVIYYSAVDWHHPQYPNLGRHHEIVTAPEKHDMDAYMRFLKAQVRDYARTTERFTGSGGDMNVPKYVDDSVNEMIRNLQPAAVINNRGYGEGDFSTPERNFQENPTLPFAAPTEACDSIGVNSWGYRREEDYYSVYVLGTQDRVHSCVGRKFSAECGTASRRDISAGSSASVVCDRDMVPAGFSRIDCASVLWRSGEFIRLLYRQGQGTEPDSCGSAVVIDFAAFSLERSAGES